MYISHGTSDSIGGWGTKPTKLEEASASQLVAQLNRRLNPGPIVFRSTSEGISTSDGSIKASSSLPPPYTEPGS